MKGKNFLIVILIVIILGLVGFICYDKGVFTKPVEANPVKEGTNDTNEKEKGKKIDENGAEVKKLINSIRTFEESTFLNSEVSNDTMTSENKITYAIAEELLLKKNIISSKTPATTQDDMYLSFIKWGDVKNRVKLMFGEKTHLERVSSLGVNQAGAGCFEAKYYYCEDENEDNCKYTLDPFGCDVGWRFDHYQTMNVSAVKYSDKIEVDRKVLHLECNPESGECDVKNSITTSKLGAVKNSKADLSSFYEKVDTIRYTFALENDNYYFESSKVVK